MNYSLKNLEASIEVFHDLSIFCATNIEAENSTKMSPSKIAHPSSFEVQFKTHYKYLCAVAYCLVEDEDTAKDIVQDFFLYCWRKRKEINITHTFRSYAVRSVRNASLNYLKRAGKIKLEETQTIEIRMKNDYSEEYSEDNAKNEALWAAVALLPEQRKRVFLLSNIQGLKYQEIAIKLNISINTVKTHIRLALQFLRNECKWMLVKFLFLLITLEFFIRFTHF